MRRCAILGAIVFVLSLTLASTLEAADFYVAPDGNDAWSGTRAGPTRRRPTARWPPWPARVRRCASSRRRERRGRRCTCGGRVLPRRDFPPWARGLGHGRRAGRVPRLSGRAADPDRRAAITGFVPHEGQILKADLAAQGLKGVYFRQLFFDGRRQHLARYPNFDPQNPYGGGWAYADGKPVPMYQDVPGENRRTLHYKPAGRAPMGRPERGRGLHLPPLQLVEQHRAASRRSTAPRGTITLAGDCSYADPARRPLLRAQPAARNSTRRASGTWTARRGTLYFWPPAAAGRPAGLRARRCGRSSSSAQARRTSPSAASPSSAARARPSCSRDTTRLPDRRLHDPQRGRLQRLGRVGRRRPAQRRGRLRHLRDRQPRRSRSRGGDRKTLDAGRELRRQQLHPPRRRVLQAGRGRRA